MEGDALGAGSASDEDEACRERGVGFLDVECVDGQLSGIERDRIVGGFEHFQYGIGGGHVLGEADGDGWGRLVVVRAGHGWDPFWGVDAGTVAG